MKSGKRRRFLALVAGAMASLRPSGRLQAGETAQPTPDEGRKRLSAALRELNEAARVGITPDEFERAERYATGAYGDMETKLRSLVLNDNLDLPVQFSPRRRRP